MKKLMKIWNILTDAITLSVMVVTTILIPVLLVYGIYYFFFDYSCSRCVSCGVILFVVSYMNLKIGGNL